MSSSVTIKILIFYNFIWYAYKNKLLVITLFIEYILQNIPSTSYQIIMTMRILFSVPKTMQENLPKYRYIYIYLLTCMATYDLILYCNRAIC